MSKFPAIPDFTEEPQSMANAVRAMKDSVEQLTGKRQGASLGSPSMFVQENEPAVARQTSFKAGDLWIKPSTRTMAFWSGQKWEQLA